MGAAGLYLVFDIFSLLWRIGMMKNAIDTHEIVVRWTQYRKWRIIDLEDGG